MNLLVSVIIPIYNTAMYLRRCIDSVVRQSYKQVEIILVDDGSIDSSVQICDDYAGIDSRVMVIHQNNRGLVNARKSGLKISHGDYIVPLDSDDWIDSQYIEEVMKRVVTYNCDMVQCGILYQDASGNETIGTDNIKNGYYDLTDIRNELYKSFFVDNNDWTHRGLRCNLCTCAFRRNIMINSQKRIPDTLANGEDDAGYFAAMLLSKSFYKVEAALYHCTVRNNSMSRNKKLYNVSQVLQIDEVIRPLVESHMAREKLMPQWDAYMLCLFNFYARQMWGFGYIPQYVFPYEIIPQRSRLVIYGAGAVGKSYVVQVDSGNHVQLVGWIDKRCGRRCQGHDVLSIETLGALEFDYVLIAISDPMIMKDIKNMLLDYGIASSKILWKQPSYADKMFYFSRNDE